mmetsp:Transcript_87908/g.262141  ORF Transcript_87908/g.262141 Transcript_87908/m.262141 type:complete len:249 (-) Transcript_87908:452-1198(-)
MGRSRVWLREGGRRQARLRPQLLLWRRAPAGRRDRLRKRSARPPYTWEVGGCEHPEGHPDGRGRRSGDGRARHRDRVERHWRLRLPVHGRREAGLRPPQFLRRQGCPHRRLQADGHHQAGPQEPRQVVRGCGQGPGSHARGRGWRRRPGPHQCPQRCTGGPRGLRPRRHRCGGCDSCAAAAVAAAAAPAASTRRTGTSHRRHGDRLARSGRLWLPLPRRRQAGIHPQEHLWWQGCARRGHEITGRNQA